MAGNGNGNSINATELIEAIKGSNGFVTAIAKRLGCSRVTVYSKLKEYPTARQALHDERESNKDFAESKLMKQIDNGNITAIIFYLKTQAKERGYVERQEITGARGEEIKVKVVKGVSSNDL